MKHARTDLWIGTFLCLLAFGLWIAVPYTIEDFEDDVLTPASFPLVLCGAIAVLSALLAWNGWRRPRIEEEPASDQASRRAGPYLLAAVAILALYIWSMPLLGYLIATPLALLALSLIYGNRHWKGLLLVVVVVPPVVFYFFEKVMVILLPRPGWF